VADSYRSKPSEEWHKQRDPWYAALGRFVVWFEWLCHQMKICIIDLEGNFNDPRTQQLAFAELDSFTAGKLLDRFNKAVTNWCADKPEDVQIFGNILERLGGLKDKRNDVIHRTWYVDFGGEDFSKAHGRKFRKTEGRPESKPLEWEARDFDELIAEARELAGMVGLIDPIILGVPLSFSSVFRIENGMARKKT
jgi:hypothetical protein